MGIFLNQLDEKPKEAVVMLNGELCATKEHFYAPGLLTVPGIFHVFKWNMSHYSDRLTVTVILSFHVGASESSHRM